MCFHDNSDVCGVIEQETINVARDRTDDIDIFKDERWVSSIQKNAFAECHHIGEELGLQEIFLANNIVNKNQYLYIKNREFISHNTLIEKVRKDKVVEIVLNEKNEKDSFKLISSEKLNTIIGVSVNPHRIYTLIDFPGIVKKDDDINELIKTNTDWLFLFLKELCRAVGDNSELTWELNEIEGYRDDLIKILIQNKQK